MESLIKRLISFKNWPKDHFLTPYELASNGFYYLNTKDDVRCAFCNVEICNWRLGDVVEEDHKRWGLRCPLVRQLMDNNKSELDRDECGSSDVVKFEYSTYEERLRTFEKWPTSVPMKPQELASAGFYYTGVDDKVQCFHCKGGLKDWVKEDDAFYEHARYFDRCEYIIKIKGSDYVRQIVAECVAKELLAAESSHIGEQGERNENAACRICYENQIDVCFLPCGHVMACHKCAVSVQKCPLCRSKFDRVQRLYFA